MAIFLSFMKDKAAIFDLKEKLTSVRMRIAHIVRRVSDRRRVLAVRVQILRELFLEEKRFLLEALGLSKRKAARDLLKRLHEVDLPGGPLEKALAHYFKRRQAEYYERFSLWRMRHFEGGQPTGSDDAGFVE